MVVFDGSLDDEVLEDFINGLNVTSGLSNTESSTGEGNFFSVLSGFGVLQGGGGIGNFLVSESDFVVAVNALGVPEGGVVGLFGADGRLHAVDLSNEFISSVVIVDVLGGSNEADS